MEVAVIKGIKNVSDLATFLGYDSPEKLYRLGRKAEAKPSYDIIEDLTNKFEDLNLRWLITGDGERLVNDKKYDATPIASGHLADENVPYITNTPATKSGKKTQTAQNPDPFLTRSEPPIHILMPKIITVDNENRENILHVSIKAAAGYVQGHADPEYLGNLPSFRLPGLTGSTFRSFEVEGDSMDPTLKNRQMVIGEWLEKLEDIREDRVHIIVLKSGKPIIKRLLNRIYKRNVIIAKSDATNNRELYKNIEIDPADVLEIWYARFHGGFDFQAPTDMWKRVNNHEADLTILQNQVDKLLTVVKSAGLLNE